MDIHIENNELLAIMLHYNVLGIIIYQVGTKC